jgi:hypothetical protein
MNSLISLTYESLDAWLMHGYMETWRSSWITMSTSVSCSDTQMKPWPSTMW